MNWIDWLDPSLFKAAVVSVVVDGDDDNDRLVPNCLINDDADDKLFVLSVLGMVWRFTSLASNWRLLRLSRLYSCLVVRGRIGRTSKRVGDGLILVIISFW